MHDIARREDSSFALTPYLIFGFVALLLALLARAPASLLQRALPSGLPIQATAWGGTLWSGQAELVQVGEPGFWRWQLQPSALLRGRVGLQVQGTGSLSLSGRLESGAGGWQARDLRGDVPARLLQPLLPPGWALPGDLRVDGVELSRKGGTRGAWQSAAGQLYWAGGAMQYNLGSEVQTATLPPLVAALAMDGDRLAVSLVEEAGGGVLADVRVAADGAIETRLRERLLKYSGRTSGASPDAVVVTSVQAGR